MSNNSFLISLLTPLRDFIVKSRPAYKDYLGRQTTTKFEELYSGTLGGDDSSTRYISTYNTEEEDIKSLLNAGEVYSVTINGVTEEIAAREYLFKGIPVGALTSLDKIPENNEEIANLPENYYCFLLVEDNGKTNPLSVAAGTFLGASIKVVRRYDVTEEKYDIKLLPEELLPKSVAKKKEIDAMSVQIAGMQSRIANPDWSQNDETAADYVKNRPGGYDAMVEVVNVTKTINGNTAIINGYSDGKSDMKQTWPTDPWEKAKVIYDGVTYIVTNDYTKNYIGDKNLIEYPFALDASTYLGGGTYTYCNYVKTAGDHEITLIKMATQPVQIPAKYISALSSENCPSGKYIAFDGDYVLTPAHSTYLFKADSAIPRPPSLYAADGVWKFLSTCIRISDSVAFAEDLVENETFTGLIFDAGGYKWGVVVTRSSDNSSATIGLKKVTAYGADATK